nr:MAG TPA: Putative head tail adaptor [Caudoviricetes sp.]
MITRKMNHRVTFFREIGGQNEDGEVISPIREDLYTCWCEIAKTSLKDFQEGANRTASDKAKGVLSSAELKTLYVRHHPRRPFDSSDHVELSGVEYDIVSVDSDESSFDMDKVSIKRRT